MSLDWRWIYEPQTPNCPTLEWIQIYFVIQSYNTINVNCLIFVIITDIHFVLPAGHGANNGKKEEEPEKPQTWLQWLKSTGIKIAFLLLADTTLGVTIWAIKEMGTKVDKKDAFVKRLNNFSLKLSMNRIPIPAASYSGVSIPSWLVSRCWCKVCRE